MRRPLFKPQHQIIIHNHIHESTSIPIQKAEDNKKSKTLVSYIGTYYEDADKAFNKFKDKDVNVVVIMNDPRR